MGIIISAKCNNCQFNETFFFGHGRYPNEDGEYQTSVPGINDGSFKVVTIKSLTNENFNSYNNPLIYKSKLNIDPNEEPNYFKIDQDFGTNYSYDIQNNFIQFGDVFLSKEKNKCPSCCKFEMNFDSVGSFD